MADITQKKNNFLYPYIEEFVNEQFMEANIEANNKNNVINNLLSKLLKEYVNYEKVNSTTKEQFEFNVTYKFFKYWLGNNKDYSNLKRNIIKIQRLVRRRISNNDITNPEVTLKILNYELCHPKNVNRKKATRIFHKKSHKCNIGNSDKITRPILTQLLNEWTPDYINPNNNYIIYPDFSNDAPLNLLWLRRCYEDSNDLNNKKIILIGDFNNISLQFRNKIDLKDEGGKWHSVCIYDELKDIYKFRSLLKWNNKPYSYKEKKMKQSLDKEYFIDYSNMDAYNEWWIELKKRICIS